MWQPSSPMKDLNAENLIVNPKRHEVCNREKKESKVTHLPKFIIHVMLLKIKRTYRLICAITKFK